MTMQVFLFMLAFLLILGLLVLLHSLAKEVKGLAEEVLANRRAVRRLTRVCKPYTVDKALDEIIAELEKKT